MPLRFKIDVLDALKKKGYSSYTLGKERLLSQSTIQKLRDGEGIGWDNLERICTMLDCQPGEIIEFVKEDAFSM